MKKDLQYSKGIPEKDYKDNERVLTLVLWYRQEKLKLPSRILKAFMQIMNRY